MPMNTNLEGRLRNTELPWKHGLMPLFEAVVNSIHSIEESKLSADLGRITIAIVRDGQQSLFNGRTSGESIEHSKIVGFRIIDNGIGFTETNMNSFRTLDSDHKVAKGGRGVGRLLWLKAFSNVRVTSDFRNKDNVPKRRAFEFNAAKGVFNETVEERSNEGMHETIVELEGYGKEYRKRCYRTAQNIANSLLEHCLWYFIRDGGVPRMSIVDAGDEIDLNHLFEGYMISSAYGQQIEIKGQPFELTHTKLRASRNRTQHSVSLCAANRLVVEEKLDGRIPGLFGKLVDGNSEFVYSCYVTSPFLDERVRAERTDFAIEEFVQPVEGTTIFDGSEMDEDISRCDIREAVEQQAESYLLAYLSTNKLRVTNRVTQFVSEHAPRYRPVLSRIEVEKLPIEHAITDKDLELTLHKELAEIEQGLISEGHELMSPNVDHEAYDGYHERLKDYLRTAEDIKKSDLANYVFHRKVILDLLQKAIEKDSDGKYVREDLIHTLLMPMRVDSNKVRPDDCNLWVIDERLAFHDYLASDKTLNSMPITGDSSTKEPDIAALNVFDNPILVSEGQQLPLASIVVVELKRPMRNDARQGEEKDPIEQALGYLERIRNGGVTTSSGRPIPENTQIPGFCYVLCDLTPSVKSRCIIHDAIETSDKLGYFFYHKAFGAYVEVISFDGLVNRAKARNRAFFDQLGLPTN